MVNRRPAGNAASPIWPASGVAGRSAHTSWRPVHPLDREGQLATVVVVVLHRVGVDLGQSHHVGKVWVPAGGEGHAACQRALMLWSRHRATSDGPAGQDEAVVPQADPLVGARLSGCCAPGLMQASLSVTVPG